MLALRVRGANALRTLAGRARAPLFCAPAGAVAPSSTTAGPPAPVPLRIAQPSATATWARYSEPARAAAHASSLSDRDGFWSAAASRFSWLRRWDSVCESSFSPGAPFVRWFSGAECNVSANCLDVHVAAGRGDAPALTWEADDGRVETYTYAALLLAVEAAAAALREAGVQRGDVVTLVLPQTPAVAIAMLACARLGAPHSAVFAGLSAAAVADRIVDARSSVVVTADVALRGGRAHPLKAIVDDAAALARAKGVEVRRMLVARRTPAPPTTTTTTAHALPPGWVAGRDEWLEDAIARVSAAGPPRVAPERMAAADPLFLLYTSGSTGKPKGVVHATAGWMVYAGTTMRELFGTRDGATSEGERATKPRGA